MRTIAPAVVVAVWSSIAALQQPPARSATDAELIRLIRASDGPAIVAAGQSGNPVFIPYLKEKLHDPVLGGTKDKSVLGIQVALIKLEDVPTMQEFWCEAIQESTNPPLESFQFIGGWYSIRSLDAVLLGAGEDAFRRAVNAARPTDLSFERPRFLAVAVLEKIAPDGPDGPAFRARYGGAVGLERGAEAWHQWIGDHETELRKLGPVGDAADLTETACKNGKPVKR